MATTTRERLIEAAGNLFYRHGFQAVGLDQIMDAVGISKTALYKHFESKDQLILAVLQERDKNDIAEAERFMRERAGGDPLRGVLALFDQLGEWFADPEFRGCLFINAATEFPSPSDPINQAAAAHSAHLFELVHLRLAAGGIADAEFVARQVMLVLNGAISVRHNGRVTEAALLAKAAVASMLGLEIDRPAAGSRTRTLRRAS
ncbi:MAG TPA: TetR/AcrR family transcriptional regulator [Phycisphaerales bacterium]|jgi:AcrR family transcriptional regulator|nr:TetR/AcrR family transcriptional regulator [Phycisphaerales bacterium]